MRAALTTVATVLLLVTACSGADVRRPVHRLPSLRMLLVTGADVDLPGYTTMTPAGEEQALAATAIRYFTAAGGFRQLTVTLVAAVDRASARAAAATAFRIAVDSLRTTTRSGAAQIGANGRRVAGRTKGYGALQDSIFFVQGAVAVSVTLSSSTPDQPPDLVTGVALAQDAKLRAG